MKKEVDYTLHYCQGISDESYVGMMQPTDEDMQNFQLMMKVIEETESQFEKKVDFEKTNRIIESYYPILCGIAKEQRGRVVLDINEKNLFAQLLYSGETLMLQNTSQMNYLNFWTIVSNADDTFVCGKGGSFEIQFVFQLYEKVQIYDHIEQIEKAKQEFHRELIKNL